ncbi:hypothetical protein ACTFIY_001597 [Dictyostelium cf. discoideum]
MNNYNDVIFFKIWRNHFIRNNILEKIKDHKNFYDSFKYEKIFSCSWMIENGYYLLLKEKVNRGENLIFNCIDSLWETNEKEFIPRNLTRKKFDNGRLFVLDCNSIFYKEKAAIHWDRNFYISLFKNYSNYFLNFNKNETESTLIEYDNQQALQIFVENFNHVLEIESFFRSFEIGSYQCSFYIFSKFKNEILKSKKYQSRIWNTLLNHSIFENEMIEIDLINQRIDFIINKCQIPIPKSLSDIQQLQQQFIPCFYEIKIYEQKLSTILDCLKTISQLSNIFKSFLKSINDKSYKIKLTKDQDEYYSKKGSSSQLNLELSNINSLIWSLGSGNNNNNNNINNTLLLLLSITDIKNKFTNKELETNIIELLITSEKNEIIFGLYRSLLPFTYHLNHFIDNWNFYQIKRENNYQDYLKIKKHTIITTDTIFHSKMFAHYKFQEFIDDCQDDNNLFRFCKTKDSQINFINNFNKDLIMTNQPKKYNLYKNILSNLVWLDDIELINLLKKPVEVEFKQNEKLLLVSKLKSNEMFDIVYQVLKMANEMERNLNILKSIDYANSPTTTNTVSNVTIGNDGQPIKRILEMLILSEKSNILQHFKNNYTLDYYSQVNYIDLTNKTFKFGIFKFVYDNLSDFSVYDRVNAWRNNLSFITNVQEFKYLVERTPSSSDYKLPSDNGLSYFKYMVQERLFDLQSGRCGLESHKHPIYQYFKLVKDKRQGKEINEDDIKKEFNDLIYPKKSSFSSYTLRSTFSKICQYHDLGLIDLIFNNASNFTNFNEKITYSKSYVQTILEVITSQGDLELFKYVNSKFPEIVSINLKDGSKSSWVNGFYRLCRPVQLALTNGHIDLLLYILSLKKTDKVFLKITHTTISFNNKCLLNHLININNSYLFFEH